MPKYFMDLKNCWGGYAKIFYGLEKMLGGGKCLGVCQQILCVDLKKKFGRVVMPKYFIDLKNVWGGGMRPYAKTF